MFRLINSLISSYRELLNAAEDQDDIDSIFIDIEPSAFDKVMEEAAFDNIPVFANTEQIPGVKIFNLLGVPITCTMSHMSPSGEPTTDQELPLSYQTKIPHTLH